jgi:hypothetical protein
MREMCGKKRWILGMLSLCVLTSSGSNEARAQSDMFADLGEDPATHHMSSFAERIPDPAASLAPARVSEVFDEAREVAVEKHPLKVVSDQVRSAGAGSLASVPMPGRLGSVAASAQQAALNTISNQALPTGSGSMPTFGASVNDYLNQALGNVLLTHMGQNGGGSGLGQVLGAVGGAAGSGAGSPGQSASGVLSSAIGAGLAAGVGQALLNNAGNSGGNAVINSVASAAVASAAINMGFSGAGINGIGGTIGFEGAGGACNGPDGFCRVRPRRNPFGSPSGGFINPSGAAQNAISYCDAREMFGDQAEQAGLVGKVPRDIDQYWDASKLGKFTGTKDQWATVMTAMASEESSFGSNGISTSDSFTESDGTLSQGIFSMTAGEEGLTSSSVFDAQSNTRAAARRMNKLLNSDNSISGLGRYWGPVARGEVNKNTVTSASGLGTSCA